jgi:hypothetical protein
MILLNVCDGAVPLIADVNVPLNRTVPVPGINVPPLFVQFDPTLTVAAVPTSNVPVVNVIDPFSVSVVVPPPTLSVCPDLSTAILLNVCAAAVPLIACAPVVLLNVTVFAPGVNVPPLFVQSPATEILPAAVTVTPELIRTLPNVIAAVGVTLTEAVNVVVEPVRSNVPLKLATLPLNAMAAAPLEVNVELPPFCVNVPLNVIDPVETVIAQPLFCTTDEPAEVVPPTERVPVPTANVINAVCVVG